MGKRIHICGDPNDPCDMDCLNNLPGGPKAPITHADYEAMERRLEELTEENGNMDSMYQDRLLDFEGRAHEAERRLAEVEAELTRLRTALRGLVETIKKAPHDMGCSSLQGGPTAWGWGHLSRCDCWKKAAIAAAEAEGGR